MTVKVSQDFGLIIKKQALQTNNMSKEKLLADLETQELFDEDENLISLGPHFGQEVIDVLIKRLENLGFVYGEDFIDFLDMIPWLQIEANLR